MATIFQYIAGFLNASELISFRHKSNKDNKNLSTPLKGYYNPTNNFSFKSVLFTE